jgi:uncharacterized protein
MKKYRLPTRGDCFELLKQHRVPEHIIKHSIIAAKLAVFLAKKLEEKGISVDVELVDRACLLHDVARPCDFRDSDCNSSKQVITEQSYGLLPENRAKWRQLKAKYQGFCHEDIAYELLAKKYPELALAVKRHRYRAILDEKDKPVTWEEKLVYYADKRIMHDRIVSLKERLEEAHKRNIHLHKRHAQSDVNTSKVDPLIFKLEEEIFSKIDLNPLEVTNEFIDSYLSDACPPWRDSQD